MILDEAIEILRQRKNCMECVMSITTKNMCDKCDAAFDLAIKALEERPQGWWIKDEEHSITINMFKCSNCNGGGYPHFRYCPHCGAEMNKEENKND